MKFWNKLKIIIFHDRFIEIINYIILILFLFTLITVTEIVDEIINGKKIINGLFMDFWKKPSKGAENEVAFFEGKSV
jgi:hypothetical protein